MSPPSRSRGCKHLRAQPCDDEKYGAFRVKHGDAFLPCRFLDSISPGVIVMPSRISDAFIRLTIRLCSPTCLRISSCILLLLYDLQYMLMLRAGDPSSEFGPNAKVPECPLLPRC